VTAAPIRIQRSRRKGWRMPENTVYVGRPTVWGNRWKIGTHSNLLGRVIETNTEAVQVYYALMWPEAHHIKWVQENLRGKNLACWCSLDQLCHADVLLEIANREPPR
jgi:Domain of unknown function (DUF4326)